MRRARLAAAILASLALAGSTVAADYSSLRSSHPEIDRAVSQLRSNGVHGDLSHLSSFFDHQRVRTFLAEAEEGEPPPALMQRQLGDALEQLTDSLDWSVDRLTLRDTLVLAQVIDLVAIQPAIEVRNDMFVLGTCASFEHQCPPIDAGLYGIPPVLEAAIRRDYAELAAADPQLPDQLPGPFGVTAFAFGDWLKDVLEAPGIAGTGVESIDDE